MNSHNLRLPSAIPGRAPLRRHLAGAGSMSPVRTVSSATVFKGETEIGIEHHGELYRLRITRQGKLILTK